MQRRRAPPGGDRSRNYSAPARAARRVAHAIMRLRLRARMRTEGPPVTVSGYVTCAGDSAADVTVDVDAVLPFAGS